MKSIFRKFFIAASMVLTVVLAGMSISYAWFVATDGDSGGSEMGKVEISITDDTKVTNGKLFFILSSDNNIDTYMRLGWTPVYRDSLGNDLPYDTTSVKVTKVIGNMSPLSLKMNPTEIVSRNGYRKNMIDFEDNNGKYYVIPSEYTSVLDIQGTLYVEEALSYPDAELHLILVPEAIQATWKAVDAASKAPENLTGEGYGWTTDKVDGQASTIVSPSTGGDE